MNKKTDRLPPWHTRPLPDKWTFYWKANRRRTRTRWEARPQRRDTTHEYERSLCRLGTVATRDEFWEQFSSLQQPTNLPCGDIYLMRGQVAPMWENFPNGAAWILNIDAQGSYPVNRQLTNEQCPMGSGIDRVWEQVCSACATGEFDANLAGVNISVRPTHFKLMLWITETGEHTMMPDTNVPTQLAHLIGLPENIVMHYKTFKRALYDNSTTLRARCFGYTKDQVKDTTLAAREKSLKLNVLPTIVEVPEEEVRPNVNRRKSAKGKKGRTQARRGKQKGQRQQPAKNKRNTKGKWNQKGKASGSKHTVARLTQMTDRLLMAET